MKITDYHRQRYLQIHAPKLAKDETPCINKLIAGKEFDLKLGNAQNASEKCKIRSCSRNISNALGLISYRNNARRKNMTVCEYIREL